ncbi:MAG: peptidase domain-containing ABC transporter [Actinomycetota bacterium]|nr:peptidase domain-containing ABC transporter [Actinomycetota bacterium]
MAKRIPYVQQLERTDCGAACLAMTLSYHGKTVPLRELRQMTGTSRDGVDAYAILRAARSYGLRGRGVTIEPDGLRDLPPGSILHWKFDHFVVFDGVRRGGVDVVDPAQGRRHISFKEFGKSFTGVAVLLEPSEDFTRARNRGKRVWRYFFELLRSQKAMIARVFTISLVIQLLALAVPILTGVVVDRIVPEGDRDLLGVLSMGFATMVLFHLLASVLRAHLLVYMRTRLDLQMTVGFIDHLVDLPYEFFLQRSPGDLMMRINSNVTIRETLTAGTLSALLDGAFVFVYLFLLFAQSTSMGTLVLGLALLQTAILLVSRRPYRRLMSENLEAQAQSQSYAAQLLTGVETLKVAGAQHRAVDHWSNLFAREINLSVARGRLSAVVDSFLAALRVASPLAVLGYGAIQVLDGDLSLGTMLALSALATGFLTPLSTLVTTSQQLLLLGSYMERINDVLETAKENTGGLRAAGRLRGGITVESVSFGYGPLSPRVVEDVTLRIEPGQTVGIVGPSGSGKSTLTSVILGLYRPASGRVTYDGVDLAELDPDSVRRQIGVVSQHPYLFGISIRDNIALTDPSLSLDAVVEAARLACIHDEVMAMPMGYETLLADGGGSLAGGERQRLALARALVHRPAIVVLDEATSALDSVTEAKVYQNLKALECTRIIVAHRLSTILHADLIVVLEHGRLAEQGKHDELVTLGGRYAELVAAQRGGAR